MKQLSKGKLKTIRYSKFYKGLSKFLIVGNLSLTLINPVMAEQELLSTLTVTGNGVEKIATTLAEVELGVEIQGTTAAQVQREIAKRTSAVVDLLRSKDVEQLQTTGVALRPNYDLSNDRRRLIGYIGTNTVSFRIQTDLVGTLLDETVKAGASRIDRVSFVATPEEISEAKQEALRKATIDARAMADVVFETLNLTSEKIVNIQIDGADVSQPPIMTTRRTRRTAIAEESFSTPIVGGEQTVRASVTLQISY